MDCELRINQNQSELLIINRCVICIYNSAVVYARHRATPTPGEFARARVYISRKNSQPHNLRSQSVNLQTNLHHDRQIASFRTVARGGSGRASYSRIPGEGGGKGEGAIHVRASRVRARPIYVYRVVRKKDAKGRKLKERKRRKSGA